MTMHRRSSAEFLALTHPIDTHRWELKVDQTMTGGMGSLFGPLIGAIVYLVLEEFLSQITEYWALIMGPLLLLIVLFGRGGILGLLGRAGRG